MRTLACAEDIVSVCVGVVVWRILWKDTKKPPRIPTRKEDSYFSPKWILENPHHLWLLCSFNSAERLNASDIVKDECPVPLKAFPSPLLKSGSLVLRCAWRWAFLVAWGSPGSLLAHDQEQVKEERLFLLEPPMSSGVLSHRKRNTLWNMIIVHSFYSRIT